MGGKARKVVAVVAVVVAAVGSGAAGLWVFQMCVQVRSIDPAKAPGIVFWTTVHSISIKARGKDRFINIAVRFKTQIADIALVPEGSGFSGRVKDHHVGPTLTDHGQTQRRVVVVAAAAVIGIEGLLLPLVLHMFVVSVVMMVVGVRVVAASAAGYLGSNFLLLLLGCLLLLGMVVVVMR